VRRSIVIPIAVALVAGCSPPASPPRLKSGELRGANVLLVTIDTLRRDRLGAYGSTSGLTPTLDRLAGSGLRYARAFSHVPMTLPAHTSILTGRTPRHHGVHNNLAFRLDDRVPTLATLLKEAGYRTGAFVGAFVLDARFGLNRGFDAYDDRYPHSTGAPTFRFTERRAAEVLKAAGDWILSPGPALEAPWFAWVHLFDPHAPYDAPQEFRAARAPYDAEVAYTDAMLGLFLERLRAARALDRTLIVVTADHGESLGEHGETTHGLFAYDATLAVPLLVDGPTIGAGIVNTPVGHADILPTVLDLAGVAAPPGLDGESLVRPAAGRPIYFEALDANLTRGWAPLTGLVRENWKYIDLPLRELYNLDADPVEETNLADRDRSRVDVLARALDELRASPQTAGQPSAPDADAIARMRALGYVGTSAARPAKAHTDADDPKRLVALNERFNTALDAFNRGGGAEALEALTAIVRERPDFTTARTSAATVLLAQGRAAAAVAWLRDAPADQRQSPELLAKLGAALREAGDLRGAAVALEQARRAGDQNPELLNDLGVVYAGLNRAADARAMFDELLRRAPNAAGSWFNLGMFELEHQHRDRAAAAFQRAVGADPSYGEAWRWLGAALIDSNRAAAIDAWQHAERLQPGDYDLLFNLGMVMAESDRPAGALPYLQRFVREAPRERYGRDIPQVEAAINRAGGHPFRPER